MKFELEKWMQEQGDTGADMDVPFNNKIDMRKEAVLVKPGWIRDPYIVLGHDGTYYLTGTTPAENDPREQGDKFNTGLGEESIVGNQLRISQISRLSTDGMIHRFSWTMTADGILHSYCTADNIEGPTGQGRSRL